MYDVACPGGRRAARGAAARRHPSAQGNIDASASLLVGGQIKGEDPRLFNIYPQGNFIEATHETLYFQLGEGKYGKPVLDRVVTTATNPVDALKCVLVSFDSTIRSNISVGLPIDVLWYSRDSLRVGMQKRDRRRRSLLQHAAPGLGRGPAAGVRRAGQSRLDG